MELLIINKKELFEDVKTECSIAAKQNEHEA